MKCRVKKDVELWRKFLQFLKVWNSKFDLNFYLRKYLTCEVLTGSLKLVQTCDGFIFTNQSWTNSWEWKWYFYFYFSCCLPSSQHIMNENLNKRKNCLHFHFECCLEVFDSFFMAFGDSELGDRAFSLFTFHDLKIFSSLVFPSFSVHLLLWLIMMSWFSSFYHRSSRFLKSQSQKNVFVGRAS